MRFAPVSQAVSTWEDSVVSQAVSTWEDSVISIVTYCGMSGCEVCSCKPGCVNMGGLCYKYSYLLWGEGL